MIKRTIVAAAAGVAFILAGCEDEPDRIEATEEAVEERVEADYEGTGEPMAEESAGYEATGTTAGTTGGAAAGTTTTAESDKLAQQQQQGQEQLPGTGVGMTGMEEEREELGLGTAPGQAQLDEQMEPTAQREGEPTTTQSDLAFSQTLARIQRELRTNDMQVVGRVRLNQQAQQQQQRTEDMGKPEEEQAQAGQQQQQRPRGQQRAELILFADPNALQASAGDPVQALSMPTAILIYEDAQSGDVFVAYDDASLQHIVDAAVREQQGQQQQGQQQQGQQQQGQWQQGQQQDWQSKPEEEPGTIGGQPGAGTGTGTDLQEPGTDLEQEPGMGTDVEGNLDY